MKRIEIKAPTKINIGLNIVSKRDDGYHNLETFFYPIHDLYDYLIFEKSDSFSFRCNDEELNNDANLIVKAVRLLEDLKKTRFNISIECRKNIPSGAGLGGGSSDAAATLISLNELFRLELKYEELITIALLIGSDVPFFLKSKPAIGTSRGEILDHKSIEINKYILLVNPRIHVSTKEAFSKIKPAASNVDYRQIFGNEVFDIKTAVKDLRNDFETPVFGMHSEIGDIKASLINSGACFSLMSGSGSTVYGFFDSNAEAEYAAKKFPDTYFTFISCPDNYFH